MQFNTAIASLMELLNSGYKFLEENENDNLVGFFLFQFLQLINPFIPHISNELWSLTRYKEENINLIWASWDEEIINKDEIKIIIQINGKTRGTLSYASNINEEATIINDVKNNKKLFKYLENKKITRTVYIENRLLNFIVK
jgi:leucyl-tRNA synthetase